MQRDNLNQDNLAKPIGAHLVCSCCHTLHVWRDCGHFGEPCSCCEPENSITNNRINATSSHAVATAEFKPAPIKPKRQRKARPLKSGLATFYAWENKDGEIIKQRGLKGIKAKHYGSRGADLYSVGDCTKGGSGRNRTLENFERVRECYSDLDPDFPLEWQEIVSLATSKGLPRINKIVRSRSEHHYQVHWDIVPAHKGTKELDLWLLVQEKIFETFRELGADPLAVKNPLQYLRDPNKYEVVYSNPGFTVLSELYKALKKNGPIERLGANRGQEKRQRNQKSFDRVTLPRLRKFFADNPKIESTHEKIYSRLEISKSTYYYLLPVLYSEGLITETVRRGKTWVTKFIFSRSKKRVFNRGGACSGEYARAWQSAKERGLAEKSRNVGVFTFALWLFVLRQWDFERVLSELEPVFLVTVSRSAGFSRSEFVRTVRSACRDRYRAWKICSLRSDKFQTLIAGLNLDRQNEL